MANYTRYLTATARATPEFLIDLVTEGSLSQAEDAIRDAAELRYSPIMPAFLVPGEVPAPAPSELTSVAFLFSPRPYVDLGTLKTELNGEERGLTHFTEGLASIVVVNSSIERARELRSFIGDPAFEYWPISSGRLERRKVISEHARKSVRSGELLVLPRTDHPELAVYVEQITASLTTLWATYAAHLPDEQATLHRIASVTTRLIKQHAAIRRGSGEDDSLLNQRKANSIVSALVELSAALSYAVTQGTSGATPILCNRSPFPHHSLLGIGGSVRALTKFTRYLESAFSIRSAGRVVAGLYSRLKHPVPASLAKYGSGVEYKLPQSRQDGDERFDDGGDFQKAGDVPLVAHFSLRHGFMESKFSVTAASESLTAETEPQWTLMTLSHEIMHSRVRTIFNALFRTAWADDHDDVVTEAHFESLSRWLENRNSPEELYVVDGLRNAILLFCYAVEKSSQPYEPEQEVDEELRMDDVRECYVSNKQLAIEALVHFHDYYFAYAYQPKMYMMAIWASWIKVAAPFTRTLEYLVRSLATVACGTGLSPRPAFDAAVETLLDALSSLERAGVRSPLFDELRRLVTDEIEIERTRALFKPFYYLIDQVRLFFASPTIAARIDRVEQDPFAEGSTLAEEYSSNIFVFGEADKRISPIRYSLAALLASLVNTVPVDDAQWLTAWNYMVISS